MKKQFLILVLMASIVVCSLVIFWNSNMRDGQISNVLASVVEPSFQQSLALFFGAFVSLVIALIAGSIALHRLLKPKPKSQFQ